MPRPVIALLTDFGLADPFVGIMKGVVLSRCPEATFIDLTHGVAPQAVEEGAFWLERSVEWLPRGSIVVAVVDPGVGTARRPLVLEALGRIFVGPDNGLLSPVAARDPGSAAYVIDPDRLGLDALNLMASRGVRLALDDTMLSGVNLALLTRCNFSMIKLACEVTAQLEPDKPAPGWIAGLRSLLKSSSLQVVAEGVETSYQAKWLRAAGVQMAQGYFFSTPLTARGFEDFYTDDHGIHKEADDDDNHKRGD